MIRLREELLGKGSTAGSDYERSMMRMILENGARRSEAAGSAKTTEPAP